MLRITRIGSCFPWALFLSCQLDLRQIRTIVRVSLHRAHGYRPFFRLSSVFQTREYNFTVTFLVFPRTKGAIATVSSMIISTCIVCPHTVVESHRSTYLCWFPARKNHANISWLAILLLCRWNGPTECTGHSCRTSIDEANIENVPLCTWTELIEQARAHI